MKGLFKDVTFEEEPAMQRADGESITGRRNSKC